MSKSSESLFERAATSLAGAVSRIFAPARLKASGSHKRLAKLAPETTAPVQAGAEPMAPAASTAAGEPARLVFLLSTERSGSTILSVALGANPHHMAPPEMHLLAYATYDEWRIDYPAALDSLQFVLKGCGMRMRDDEIDRTFHGWKPEAIYRWLLDGRLPADRLLIDKTPKYARDPATLARLEAFRPHYIWLVRHPLAVAASQVELRRTRSLSRLSGPFAPLKRPFVRARHSFGIRRVVTDELTYWRAVNGNIDAFVADIEPPRVHRVSFERFVRDPEPELRALCAWLGTEFDAAMLDPQRSIPTGMGPLVGDPKLRQHRRIDPAVADAWRSEVDEDFLDPETLAAMKRWGVAGV